MIKFRKLRAEDMPKVLRWRTSDFVASKMLTTVTDSLPLQLDWFANIDSDDTKIYWIFGIGKTDIGVINLSNIDTLNKRSTAGYYVGEPNYRNLAALIPPFIYNYAFFDLGLNKIYGDVVSDNESILRIHRLHGYDIVGIHRQHVVRYGNVLDVVVVELLASRWRSLTRFHQYKLS
jgi:UDP-4-amino-4,6-dideoxy-N-acetyl-beta-L-altrosamine N-acetyltransferase